MDTKGNVRPGVFGTVVIFFRLSGYYFILF
jgi:hypothetical protein